MRTKKRTLGMWTSYLSAMALAAACLLAWGSRLAYASGPIDVANNEVIIEANGKCSLIEALLNANDTVSGIPYGDCTGGNPSGPDIVRLPAGGLFLVKQTYSDPRGGPSGGAVGLPAITSDITIEGNGASIRRESRSTLKFRLFTVLGGNLTLRQINLQSGDATGLHGGGGIFVSGGNLTLVSSQMLNNRADTAGGAILLNDSTLSISGSHLYNNTATDGGALYLDHSSAALSDSDLSGNIATRNGGGIYLIESNAQFTRSNLSTNLASNRGGGWYNDAFSLATIEQSTVAGNRAKHSDNLLPFGTGGGVYNGLNGNLIVASSTFSGNSANGSGGAIHSQGASWYGDIQRRAWLTISNSTFSANQALDWSNGNVEQSGDGGAISSASSIVYLGNNTVTANIAIGRGGGGFLSDGDAVVERNLVSGNQSSRVHELFSIYTAIDGGFNVYGHAGITTSDAIWIPDNPTDRTATSDGSRPTTLANILNPTLSLNGGPTESHALVYGSPAVDMAPNVDCTVGSINGLDQRGQQRNQSGDGISTSEECDAGSYELRASPLRLYVSSRANGKLSGAGLNYESGDILEYDTLSRKWDILFDASANNIKKNVVGFGLLADGSVLLAFNANQTIPGLGTVTPWDVVSFSSATGSWSWVLDGSAVGLTTASEKIDAITTAPNGELVISTTGKASVPDAAGANLKVEDEDLIVFSNTDGARGGNWAVMLDGSLIPGLDKEDVVGASIDPVSGEIYLLLQNTFSVAGIRGGNREIIVIGRGPENTITTEKAPISLAAFGFKGIPDSIEIR